MVIGIPTKTSHGGSLDDILREFDTWLITLDRQAADNITAMAAGPVSDLVVKNLWDIYANAENRIDEIRRSADFHDAYARYRGLSFSFNCTNDVNAATDKIINLPTNHKFKTEHVVDFKIIQGALPGTLAEDTNYRLFDPDAANGTVRINETSTGTLTADLTNATGTAEMVLNIKPNLSSLRTAVDAVLDEIELNLTQRASTYDRLNLTHTYSTYSTLETATLRTKLQDVRDLIDTAVA